MINIETALATALLLWFKYTLFLPHGSFLFFVFFINWLRNRHQSKLTVIQHLPPGRGEQHLEWPTVSIPSPGAASSEVRLNATLTLRSSEHRHVHTANVGTELFKSFGSSFTFILIWEGVLPTWSHYFTWFTHHCVMPLKSLWMLWLLLFCFPLKNYCHVHDLGLVYHLGHAHPHWHQLRLNFVSAGLFYSSLCVPHALSCAHLFICLFFLCFRIKEEPKPQPAQ